MQPTEILALLLLSYLIGSIPFGLLLTRFFGYRDIRKEGSGNIGATNVLRTTNKPLAALTLFFDAAKGAAAIILSVYYLTYKQQNFQDLIMSEPFEHLIFGFAAILGHCFPIWLKFKGGKGVATTFGVLLVTMPVSGIFACLTWLLMVMTTRISSLSALIAMALAPILAFLQPSLFFSFLFNGGITEIKPSDGTTHSNTWIDDIFFSLTDPETLWVSFLYAASILPFTTLIFWKHKDNIRRLLKGTEPKIGKKKMLQTKTDPAPLS